MFLKIFSKRAQQWRSFFSTAALLLIAGATHASGFAKVTVPATGKQKAFEVTLWTPCDKPVKAPFATGPFRLQVIPGCPVAG